MKLCPYAARLYGCNALKSAGYASDTITVSESWRDQYCTSGKYQQCPNLKSAHQMKGQRGHGKGGYLPNQPKEIPSTGYNRPASKGYATNQKASVKSPKKKQEFNPVHAHGGVTPHFCEKPWRSPDLRFRVIRSLFYIKPWK
ncbi:hypothetical protein Dred_2972 [Desulforamulus reducens MI-1]|uniref:Uncharacterized protein n=1 Tax=Desulforamulus reducens (strain ATCC BAA-1160 / DSM 100696 / MI-1) TaxID=349161 RepID=A4J8S2_DESRM|nr:hypothetical protein [Desulforamulus reducens]ABO51475.1 hypothetical protein Dred_2972 [Desulforamulus reducens MI-1]